MQRLGRIAFPLFALAVAAACSTTTVTERQMADPNERVARPDRILVHDFAAEAADLHGESALAGQHGERSAPPTAEELAVGRQLGAPFLPVVAIEIPIQDLLLQIISALA